MSTRAFFDDYVDTHEIGANFLSEHLDNLSNNFFLVSETLSFCLHFVFWRKDVEVRLGLRFRDIVAVEKDAGLI